MSSASGTRLSWRAFQAAGADPDLQRSRGTCTQYAQITLRRSKRYREVRPATSLHARDGVDSLRTPDPDPFLRRQVEVELTTLSILHIRPSNDYDRFALESWMHVDLLGRAGVIRQNSYPLGGLAPTTDFSSFPPMTLDSYTMNPTATWTDPSTTGRPILSALSSSLDYVPNSLASPTIAIRAPTLPFPALDHLAAPMYPEADFLSATSYTGTSNFAFVPNSTTAMYGSDAVVDDPEEVGSNWDYDSAGASPAGINGSDWATVADHLSQQARPLSPNSLARIATDPFSASPSPADTGIRSPNPSSYSPSHGSRSPSPNPSATDLTSQSRPSATHSRRGSSASASHHRRRSSNASSNGGYSPYPATSQRSPRPADADSTFHPSPEASPSTRLDELHLHSPKANYFAPLPSEKAEKSGGRYPGKGMRRSREFAIDDGQEYKTNEEDLFVIHFGIPAKGKKTAVTERTCVQIELDESTPANERTGVLWRERGTSIEEDGEEGGSYVFVPKLASDGNRPSGRWRVVYSPSLGVLVDSLDPPPPGSSYVPRTTFIHFLPHSIVIYPAQPIGSTEWWRVQVCVGKHPKSPDKGDWSARFDKRESSADRRPVRVVQHFATCTNRVGEEGGLTGLAKAVIAATRGEEE